MSGSPTSSPLEAAASASPFPSFRRAQGGAQVNFVYRVMVAVRFALSGTPLELAAPRAAAQLRAVFLAAAGVPPAELLAPLDPEEIKNAEGEKLAPQASPEASPEASPPPPPQAPPQARARRAEGARRRAWTENRAPAADATFTAGNLTLWFARTIDIIAPNLTDTLGVQGEAAAIARLPSVAAYLQALQALAFSRSRALSAAIAGAPFYFDCGGSVVIPACASRPWDTVNATFSAEAAAAAGAPVAVGLLGPPQLLHSSIGFQSMRPLEALAAPNAGGGSHTSEAVGGALSGVVLLAVALPFAWRWLRRARGRQKLVGGAVVTPNALSLGGQVVVVALPTEPPPPPPPRQGLVLARLAPPDRSNSWK